MNLKIICYCYIVYLKLIIQQREHTVELFPPVLFSFAFVLFKTCQAVFSFKWLKKDENSQFKRSFPFKSFLDVYIGCTLEGFQILGKVNAHIYSGAKQIFSDLEYAWP